MVCKKKRHKKCHFFNSKGDKNAVQNCVVVISSGSMTGAEIDPNLVFVAAQKLMLVPILSATIIRTITSNSTSQKYSCSRVDFSQETRKSFSWLFIALHSELIAGLRIKNAINSAMWVIIGHPDTISDNDSSRTIKISAGTTLDRIFFEYKYFLKTF